jgi:adenylylsulfate kinase-like enzyme
MTGVGAPYEVPTEPDLVLCSQTETVEEEVDRVIELLIERGLIAPLGGE